MQNKLKVLLLFFLVLLPTQLVFAQVPCLDAGAPCITNLSFLTGVILQLVWVVFTVIVVVCFVTSGVLFLTAQGDPAKLKIARQAVIWGVVGVLVGIIAFSIVFIIGSTVK